MINSEFIKGPWKIDEEREKNAHGAVGIDISQDKGVNEKFCTIWASGIKDNESLATAKAIVELPTLLELVQIMEQDYNGLDAQRRLTPEGMATHLKIKEVFKRINGE